LEAKGWHNAARNEGEGRKAKRKREKEDENTTLAYVQGKEGTKRKKKKAKKKKLLVIIPTRTQKQEQTKLMSAEKTTLEEAPQELAVTKIEEGPQALAVDVEEAKDAPQKEQHSYVRAESVYEKVKSLQKTHGVDVAPKCVLGRRITPGRYPLT